jgi:hypothetical protein
MDLVLLVLGIALIGLLVWVIQTYVPMPDIFKIVIYVIVAIALIFYVVRHFSGSVPNVLP